MLTESYIRNLLSWPFLRPIFQPPSSNIKKKPHLLTAVLTCGKGATARKVGRLKVIW